MGEGFGDAIRFLMIFAVVGVLSILGGVTYGLFKLITWLL